MTLLEQRIDDDLDAFPVDTAAPAGTDRPRRSLATKRALIVGGVAALVLAVSAGTLVSMTKSVTITVDGTPVQVSTLSGSVAGALDSAGLAVGEHDVLAPAAETPITDGSTVTLNHGRLLTVSIDGVQQQIWTTARTVDEAVAALGIDTARVQITADRSRQIPLEGMTLAGGTLHNVSISDGAGAAAALSLPGATVADVLAAKGITLDADDTVTPALETAVTDGLAIAVNRTVVDTTVATEAIAQPADVTTEDPNMNRGTTAVTVQGAPGAASVTYQVITVNGTQTAKSEVSRTVTTQPVATQISVGTKSTLRWEGNQVFFDDFEYGVNWDGLANCESTHNPQAVNANPSAGLPTYGLFQFDLPTWASVGGSGNPMDATPEEQITRAKLLYQSRGLEPWACAYAAH